jgi:hypothetical protein
MPLTIAVGFHGGERGQQNGLGGFFSVVAG